jgi:hypothetical protein
MAGPPIFSKAKRSKKFDTSAPKIKFYKSKKGKIEIVEKPVEKVGQPRPVDERKLSYMQTVRILRPDLTDEQLEQAWGVYHALIAHGLPKRERAKTAGADMKALSRQEVAALREGDIVYVRMEVRRSLARRIRNGSLPDL